MISLDDYRFKWNGKTIDTDNAFGGQCMDNMHKYCQDVLGLQDLRILAAPAAKDVYLNFANIFGNQYFTKTDNSPTGVPQKGDIVFWGTGVGQFGHVAIFLSGDTNQLVTFDQNWNGHQYCETVTHNYNGVLGWLRYKPTPPSGSDALTACLAQHQILVDQANQKDAQIKDLTTKLALLDNQLTTLQTKIDKAKTDLNG